MYFLFQICQQLLLICFVLFCISCGRKQRTIFHFAHQQTAKINKLDLPVVRGVQATRKNHIVNLAWHPIDISHQMINTQQEIILIGYNIYRLRQQHVIPKKSLNKKPLNETSYTDMKKKNKSRSYCYLVRGVFKANNQQILGPISQIVCTLK